MDDDDDCSEKAKRGHDLHIGENVREGFQVDVRISPNISEPCHDCPRNTRSVLVQALGSVEIGHMVGIQPLQYKQGGGYKNA